MIENIYDRKLPKDPSDIVKNSFVQDGNKCL